MDAIAAECWQPIPLTAEIAEEVTNNVLSAPENGSFALGYLSYLRPAALENDAPFGGIVLVRTDSGFSAVLPHDPEFVVAAFLQGPTVFIVTQHQIEGPGSSFTLVRTEDGLSSATCTSLDFPGALNRPTYAMETLSEPVIEIGPDGRGRLFASAEVDLDTDHPRTTWWEYRTRDSGRTWSKPRRLPVPKGSIAPSPDESRALLSVTAPPSPALIDAIRGQAAR